MVMSSWFSGSTVSESPLFASISKQQSPVTSTESIRKLLLISFAGIVLKSPSVGSVNLKNKIIDKIRQK